MKNSNTIHVEVCQRQESTLSKKTLKHLILNTIVTYKGSSILTDKILASHENIAPHVRSISSDEEEQINYKCLEDKVLEFHFYRLSEENAAPEVMEGNDNNLPAMSEWILPSTEFYNLWENLYFDSDVKKELLSFVETTMLFSVRKINPNIISFNRVVFLNGPPGTGKTSLCKALAQKMAIRWTHKFDCARLIEINSHSLFSKWFSESGKLVMKLFDKIKQYIEQPSMFICILIDEIESLAHVRKVCQNGIEPTDSIRVVNALLTQLDQIKRYPNILILTTSNLNEAVDLAFIDRADIKQYISHITAPNIYKIYKSCLEELMRVGFIQEEVILPLEKSQISNATSNETKPINNRDLYDLCVSSEGFSGRTLRKIPFLTYASCTGNVLSLSEFLTNMNDIITKQKMEAVIGLDD